MFARFKLAVVGTAVAAGIASSLGALSARETHPASPEPTLAASQDKRAASPTLVKPEAGKAAVNPECAKQAWPHVTPDCLAAAQGAPPRQVRRISMGPN